MFYTTFVETIFRNVINSTAEHQRGSSHSPVDLHMSRIPPVLTSVKETANVMYLGLFDHNNNVSGVIYPH